MFSLLARSVTLKRLASRYGMTPNGFARRFIAGETIDEAIEAARAAAGPRHARHARLPRREREHDQGRDAATREYVQLIETIVASGIERNISLKLTQLGLTIDRATCVDNLRRILEPASAPRVLRPHRHGELARTRSSRSTCSRRCGGLEFRNVGIALQSSLHRTEQDVRRMNELGARVRLVKGAYKEPASVAFQQKADVDAAYIRQMRLLLDHGVYPAIATHDEEIIAETRSYAAERTHRPATDSSFRCCTASAAICRPRSSPRATACASTFRSAKNGFPYFMRRLGERPANVGFVLRALLGEKSG